MDKKGNSTVTVERTDEGAYRTSYDPTKGNVTVTVTLALAEVAGTDPDELLAEWGAYVDPDALDRLFRERPNGDRRHPGSHVHLAIDGVGVTIYSDGLIELDA